MERFDWGTDVNNSADFEPLQLCSPTGLKQLQSAVLDSCVPGK